MLRISLLPLLSTAANFTAYQELKAVAAKWQNTTELPSYQTATIGLISGALGPFSNAPIDTIKTRIQRASRVEGETAFSRVAKVARDMFAQEGISAFWKGITPRVARVAPGEWQYSLLKLDFSNDTLLMTLRSSCRLYHI